MHSYNDALWLTLVQCEGDVVHNYNDASWLTSVQCERGCFAQLQ